MDAIASSVAGTDPERQAKRIQMNALRAQAAKRSATATVELVDAPAASEEVEKNKQGIAHAYPNETPTKGSLVNFIA